MGFLDAALALGMMDAKQSGGKFARVDGYTQMPMNLIEPIGDKPKVLPGMEIRVWLDVVDPDAECLDVRGIKKIDLSDFFAGDGSEKEKKRRYLYRDAVGSSARWRFAPIYKLGKGVADGKKPLTGNDDWSKDSDSRFYKLYISTLNAFEERGAFTPGSVDRIMQDLVENVPRISSLWSDNKRSYLLIFGLEKDGEFAYPIDVNAFLTYFNSCIDGIMGTGDNTDTSQKTLGLQSGNHTCSFCANRVASVLNVDSNFAFATFDKESFLPGLNKKAADKVFPICSECGQLLSAGRNVLDGRFLDTKSLYGVRIYIAPELVMSAELLPLAVKRSTDFISTGLKNESFLSEIVLEQDDSLVYHFIFWEKNQSQERILLMVEDVPPTWLNTLSRLWQKSRAATTASRSADDGESPDNIPVDSGSGSALDRAIKVMAITFRQLSGKSDNDAVASRDWLMSIIGSLLNREKVDVTSVKSRVISRLQGLCADPDWVSQNRVAIMRGLNTIIDWLYRVNAQLTS